VYPEGEFHYVLHAATEASARLNAENPREMFGSIVAGTEHVLGFAAEKGVRKFLLTSSGAVYGKQPSEITHVPETYMGAPDPLQPGSAYGIGKRAAEHLCVLASAAKGFEVKIARCFAFVGPHLPLDTHFAIGNFIRDALLGQPIVIQGDGTPYRSYLYASDLAVALWTILFRGMSARAYNVGSGRDLSILQLAGAVCSAMGLPESVRTLTKPLDATRPSRYVPDVQQADLELDVRERVSLTDAIRKTVDWCRAEFGNSLLP
jgi:dTDP-glucose 4,6-dehydratase